MADKDIPWSDPEEEKLIAPLKRIAEMDRMAYGLAKKYLPGLKIEGVTDELVEKYLNQKYLKRRPSSKRAIFQRLLKSAQNANMKAGVIGRSIGGVRELALVLDNFDPGSVLRKYGDSWEAVLAEIVKELKPRGQIRKTPRSIWPQYCRSILSAAVFIEQFQTEKNFYEWVELFDRDEKTRPALPLLLSREIDGFGFALSCDFLKEIGFKNFPKPDVHLRDIFTALSLVKDGKSDFRLFKAIVRVAANADASPFSVDKAFWLIGSGYFYDDPQIGKNGRIGSRKRDFIEYARPLLRRIK